MRLVVLLVLASACTGTLDSPPGNPTAPDASTAGGGPDGGGSAVGPDGGAVTAFPCKNAVTTALSGGHHNAGQDCLQGCHNHGFTLSGTLYDAAGTTALPGASITVKDAGGKTFDMVAQ